MKRSSLFSQVQHGALSLVFGASCFAFVSSARAITPSDFARHLDITVAGYAGSSTLTNFPVLVQLSTSIPNFSYADFQGTDGSDLRFMDANGTELPYEIASWNTSGTSLVWVRVPTITGTTTKITALFGNASPAAAPASHTVWSNYATVLHLDGTFADAAGVGGVDTSSNVSILNTAIVGGGYQTTAARGNLTVSTAMYGALTDIGVLSVSFWAKNASPNHGLRFCGTKGNWSDNGYEAMYFSSGSFTHHIAMRGNGSGKTAQIDASSVTWSNWNHLVFEWNNTTAAFFVNGYQLGTGTIDANTTRDAFHLGTGGVGEGHNGIQWDEMRVYNGAMSQDYAKAEHDSIANAAFLVYGTVTAGDSRIATISDPLVERNSDGTFTVTALYAGSDTSYTGTLRLTAADGTGTPIEIEGSAENGVFTATTPATLANETTKTWTATVVVTSDSLGIAREFDAGTFHTGTLSISCAPETVSLGLGTPLVFTVTRTDSAGDIAVAYAVAPESSAVEGTHFCALSGTVTIPAGDSSATIVVQPIAAGSTELTVTLGLAPGLYGVDSSAATATGRILPSGGSFDPRDFEKTIEFTVGGYVGMAGLDNFPVLVRLSTAIDGFFYDDFQAGGADLRFTDENGTELPCEIDTWDTNGTSLVWVRLPVLDTGTRFHAYYGSTNPSVAPLSSDVWSDYAGVWHLGESGGGIRDIADSTANGLRGTSMGSSLAVEGMVGAGQHIANSRGVASSFGRILVPQSTALAVAPRFSVSGWFHQDTDQGNNWSYLVTTKNTDSSPTWGIQLRGMTLFSVYTSGDSDAKHADFTIPDISSSGWTHFQVVYGDGEVSLYLNGFLNDTVPYGLEAANGTEGFGIGGNVGSPSGFGAFVGAMDEVRVRTTEVSGDWAAAEYATQTSETFVTAGSVEALDATAAALGAPVVSKIGNSFAMTVEQTDGTGDLFAVYGGSYPFATTNLIEAGAEPGTYSYTFPDLATNATYQAGVVSINANGTAVRKTAEEVFYNGILTVEKTQDGNENSYAPVVFTISRGDTHGNLIVNFLLDGTALGGRNYVVPESYSAVIRDGSSSVDVTLGVVRARQDTTSLTLTLADGLYLFGSAAPSATASIAAFETPAGYNTWICPGDSGSASQALYWSEHRAPVATDKVLFGGEYSSAHCAWGADAVQEVASWTQLEDYTGTVSFAISAATFPAFEVTGNMSVEGGRVLINGNSGSRATNRLSVGGDLLVGGTAVVGMVGNTTTTVPNGKDPAAYVVTCEINVSGDLTVDTNAVISVNSSGLRQESHGKISGFDYGCHGGALSSTSSITNASKAYGSILNPELPGFNQNNSYSWQLGGGVLKLFVGGGVTLNGQLQSIGYTGQDGGTYVKGAGGSIQVKAGSLSGSGRISVQGKFTCGGRMAVRLTDPTATFDSFTGDFDAGYRLDQHAAPGTVYLQEGDKAEGEGTILVDGRVASRAMPTYNPSVTPIPANGAYPDAPADLEKCSLHVVNRAQPALTADLRLVETTMDALSCIDLNGHKLGMVELTLDGNRIEPGIYSVADLVGMGYSQFKDSSADATGIVKVFGKRTLIQIR